MSDRPAPFSPFEWLIAWRYLRARRAEGGVSVMTWISLIGITLAVFALVSTLAVRAGVRAEFLDTILGSNAHVTVYNSGLSDQNGNIDRTIPDYDAVARQLAEMPDVTRAAPLVRGQVMATHGGRNGGVEVFGIRKTDLLTIPRIAAPRNHTGKIDSFGGHSAIAIGSGVAQELGVIAGDKIKLISPNGVKGPFGTSPRVKSYEVVYIFTTGRWDIDRTRAYMPFAEAQSYFNREGVADEMEVMVADPEQIDAMRADLLHASGPRALLWTWRDRSGAFLRALKMQDNALFIILAILILIAALNIVSGLIMLVKNKGRDVGILRTIGLTEGSILRVFFLCGASVGTLGTLIGVILGVIFSLNINYVYRFMNFLSGNGVQDLELRGFFFPAAIIQPDDILLATFLSLGLSWLVTLFPARRAARMNPVEALRYE